MIKLHVDQINYESLVEMNLADDDLVEWLCINSLATLGRSWDGLAANVEETITAMKTAQQEGIDSITLIANDDDEVCHIYGGSLEQLSKELKKLKR